MDEVVRYSFRLRPGRIAESALLAEWDRCRYLWNGAVLAKGVSIPVVWSRELPSEPTSVRITRDSLGHWYASFVVRRTVEPVAMAEGGIGIDWGVSTTATATDPAFDLSYRGYRSRCAAELARVQRKMARRRVKYGGQSRGYQRAAHAAAKLAKKAARQTEHDSRVWAKGVVHGHGLIAVEDFAPRFLAKSTLARKAADAAVGAAKRELIERGVRAGRRVVLVRPAYTSMTCSSCFARAERRFELGDRVFRCHGCGYTECRDRNAARVILAVAERGHTRVEDVRQAVHLPRVVRLRSEREIPCLQAGEALIPVHWAIGARVCIY